MAPETATGRDHTSKLLSEAIETTSAPRLKEALREICDKIPEAFDIACSKLLVADSSVTQEESGPNRGQKRKPQYTTQRFEACEQCEKEFDVEEKDAVCFWHPGDLDPDYDDDFWADHEEDQHGVIDTDEMREEFPEGFKWSCCQGQGDAKGCESGPHKVNETKKARLA